MLQKETELHRKAHIPERARIIRKQDLTDDVRFFQMRYTDDELVYPLTSGYRPGQFMMMSIPTAGEAPFSINSSPTRPGLLEFCIRNAGRVTGKLFELKENSFVWLRGPFGNGFPIDQMLDMNLLFVAGGLGVAPLRSLLLYALDNRDHFQEIYYLYGARTPADMLFREEFFLMKEREDFHCFLTVDSDPSGSWPYKKGVVTTLFRSFDLDGENTIAVVCGPPVMYKFVVNEFLRIGIPDDQIFMTLERRMKCGMGKCGQCVVGHKYSCVDGPIFTLWDVKNIEGLI
jgi:NAD(P)H-flavin reductase